MKDWLVAIPSYKREETLKKRTLKTLLDGGVPANRIHIFVASEAERTAYERVIPLDQYAKITVGVRGLGAQRNFITNHFPEGQLLVQIDDDVQGVHFKTAPNKSRELTDLPLLFDEAFTASSLLGARLWGLYPLYNPFYMRDKVSVDLRPIIGTLWGNVNDKSLQLACAVKSDLERTLQYYVADGTVLRINHTAPKQNARSEPGGHQADGTRTLELSEEAAATLLQRYPAFVTRSVSRKGGHSEVKLKDTFPPGYALTRAADLLGSLSFSHTK